ncbi:MAG: hypothetical protein PWQ77_2190 [Kosmotogales bacterium]|nr:hypothetical protein [Kosmotogales bacterium]
MYLLKNIEIFGPEYLGRKDLFIAGDKVQIIEKDITESPLRNLGAEVIDCSGDYLIPGFVDGHVHLIGGGGEGGFYTRTSEGNPEDFVKYGTTTIIGLLGTDGITRNHRSLLAKARAFNIFGVETFIMTGSYRFPLKTITGDVMEDIVLIPEIIGVGELAIADHRGSDISVEELQRLTLDTRVAGMLSGKAGKVILHVGPSSEKLDVLFEIVKKDILPSYQFLPTHIARSEALLNEGLRWIEEYEGYIDFTASERIVGKIAELLNNSKYMNNICISTDGLGSLPVFNSNHELVSIKSSPVDGLINIFRKLVKEEGVEIQKALLPFTKNPSTFFRFDKNGIGTIRKGSLASFSILDKDLNIKDVFLKGKRLDSII